MAITATLDSLDRVRDEWRFSITYNDTVTFETFTKNYRRSSITAQQMRDLARREASGIDDNASTDIGPGAIGITIDVTPPPVIPPVPPTQAQIDRAAWFDDFRQLQAMLTATEAVPALLTAQAQTAISNLRTSLQAGWLNSYLNGIR